MPAPMACSSSTKECDNNHGSTSSASIVATAALSSASRDVFQGLFLDLGKQAMAMEAVLRLICGKVDSMEAWMTEVAFGMTELDLKLRNIAHNIEGTAANVDDEAANVHRWAAPPSQEDDRAHVAATVKKKLGPNKKTIKVSEMVAAVVDTLSIPADERDSAVFSPSASASSVTGMTAVAAHKKKASIAIPAKKQHHKKKPKDDKPLSKETVSSINDNEAGGGEDTEKLVADEQPIAQDGVEEPPELVKAQTPIPVLAEQTQEDCEVNSIDLEEKSEPGREKANDSSAIDGGDAHTESVTEEEPTQYAQQETEATVMQRPESGTQQPSAAAQQSQDVPIESKPSATSDQLALVEVTSLAPEKAVAAVSEAVDDVDEEQQPPTAQAQAHTPVTGNSSASKSVEKPQPQPQPTDKEASLASGGYLPSPPQEDNTTQATSFQLSSSVTTSTTDSNSPPAADQASSPGKLTKKRSSKKQMANESDSTTSKPTLVKKKSSRKALEAAMMRKASSCRKSQFKSPKPKSTAAPMDDNGHEQRAPTPVGEHIDTTNESSAVVDGQVLAQTSPKVDTQRDNGAKAEGRDSEAEDKGSENVDESSSEDDSDSSSSSSESDNQDGAEGKDANANANASNNAAVKSAARRLSKMPGPTSKMTRTITALKKLKEANMLTPEEEEELKQRAQEKWFKLKGHVKEKKKKDVANILLKRKKNVFTVSARIELLEDKSKEVFASIKQLHNDLKTKTDISANDILRRQVLDINLSLQALDHKITHGATPSAMEKVVQLGKEVEFVRASFSQQLVFVNEDIAATKLKLAASGNEHRDQLEFLSQNFQHQVANLVEQHNAKLRDLPDHSAAIEGVKRMLRRKADLKLLKEYVVIISHETHYY